MKKIVFLASVILTHSLSYGQNQNNYYKIMIDSAIVMQTAAYKPNIYLIDELNQPFIISSDKFQKKFRYIALFKKRNRKQLKKGINAWKIFPVLNGNKLTIDIVDYRITYRRNNYAFGNGGGAKVIFEYSCNEKKWILLESKWLGI